MFKVGDRVKCIKEYKPVTVGMTGKVVKILSLSGPLIYVDWDREHSLFHNCDEYARENHGWNVREENIVLVKGGSVKNKPTKLSWAVKYDKDVDPTEYFTTRPRAVKRIEELSKDTSVSHILLLHIDTQWDVTITQSVTLKKVI